ncbi:MAG: flagellar biosynthesis anti-sigma factor FlgM [Clostridiaceae bacterium]
MKIDQIPKSYAINAYKISEERKNGHVEGKPVKKTTVEISSEAKALVKRIGESEEFNFSERVEAIRQSIIDGSYGVDTEKLADKIMEKIDSEKVNFHE